MQTVYVQGASRGIGLALVRALLARSPAPRIFASARRPEGALAELAEASAGRLSAQPLDATDEDQVAAAMRAIGERAGELDLVLNSAGLLHELGPEDSGGFRAWDGAPIPW
ncbi:SDR family NAD(P)-dependent oxidoreductase [Haliangium ochraceum]|uniref:Short-chain dehydrogenase/reductase SDR n=1 Tax=Haliangium ochraceum (strain DSM 14365 / JCM 11303 / SMP-2) TaxID=502025 RepID=D0LYE3_HALO1|nr:SDR family NAD(P)-dependent oxidoreductase [Haliangium ochraceum]ACY16293.1 short-chain dehydrogenase/reductase SDR [Haliangium ochraceum DSM 14365]